MEEIVITELPKHEGYRVFKISAGENVLGSLHIKNNFYIWCCDLFSERQIGIRTATNYYTNYEKPMSWPTI